MIVSKAEERVMLTSAELSRLEPDEPIMLTAEDMLEHHVKLAQIEADAAAAERVTAEADLTARIKVAVDETVERILAKHAPVAKTVTIEKDVVRDKHNRIVKIIERRLED